MKKLFMIFSGMLLLAACTHANDEEYRGCVERGISYYKEIGSYPNLKSENISAKDKARELCQNAPKAAFQ